MEFSRSALDISVLTLLYESLEVKDLENEFSRSALDISVLTLLYESLEVKDLENGILQICS